MNIFTNFYMKVKIIWNALNKSLILRLILCKLIQKFPTNYPQWIIGVSVKKINLFNHFPGTQRII